ncbi:facilitated trehalose transporter Tret1-2 homolog [Homarus americanus]|uniref:facilitated trehalose transporter Tret1-2 homolog n=1 Tax=Homarus americanus TaxID=6706 RepID=UPI001C463CE9|nr:facilitated trehalose transporter Tret1-2 homolog [Homarus americanus]
MALVQLIIGTIMGFSGITLLELTSQDSQDIRLNPTQAALYSSTVNIGAAVGCLVGGAVLVRLGHRVTLLVTLPVTAALWLLLSFSPSAWVLLTSRSLLGAAAGVMSSGSSPYVIEIAHKSNRGSLVGLTTLARQMGVFLVSALGGLKFDWRQMGFVFCGVSVIPFIGLFLLPNSPRWLVVLGRVSEAEKALTFFRGKHYDSKTELMSMKEEVEGSDKTKTTVWQQLGGLLEPSTCRIFCWLAFLNILVAFNGCLVLASYLVPIFKVAQTDIDAYTCAMIFSFFRVVGSVVYIFIVDRLGRKPLIIVSYSVAAVSMAVFGGYFYLQTTGSADTLGWLPVTVAVIFIFFAGIGQPVFSVLAGELMPISSRSVGYSFQLLIVMLGSFISVQLYPSAVEAVGEDLVFWFFSGICVTITIVSAVALPETKGRSLEEITGQVNNQVATI